MFATPGIVYIILMFVFLLLGWYVTGSAVKWKSPKPLRANLFIFVAIEAVNILNSATRLMTGLSASRGQYYFDEYGVAYEDYLLIYGGLIIASALYIWMCCVLAGETKKRAPKKDGM